MRCCENETHSECSHSPTKFTTFCISSIHRIEETMHGNKRLLQNFAFLDFYAASSENRLPKFRDTLSFISSRVFMVSLPLKTRLTGCPETSVSNYHYSVRNSPEERGSRLGGGRSLKSCEILFACPWLILPARTELMECEAVSGKYSDFMFRSMVGGRDVSLVIIS
jgi:hypothetical protein